MDLRLVGIQGAKVGQTVALSGIDVTIGREADNSLSFPGDSQVSRHHARISGGVIQDLGSTNGTLVNGQRIAGPTPLNVGDLVQIGGHQFRVEAPRPAETPNRGGPSARPKERGTIESLYPKGAPTLGGNGCAMPSIDFSGCAKALIFLLIMLVVVLVLKVVLMLIGIGIGAMTASQTAPHQPGPQQSAPPPAGQDQPPPQSQEENQEGIQILEVRIDYGKRDGATIQPIVLVKWRNGTQSAVGRILGTVTVFDREGKRLAELPGQTIYHDTPVAPGEVHEDTVRQGGVAVSRSAAGVPDSAKIKIERVE